MHRRFICSHCHMKWFVDADAPREDDPVRCAGCGGALVAFADPSAVPATPASPRQRAFARVRSRSA